MQNIKKHYEPSPGIITPVLKGVNIEIKAGEFAAIMGPSGSGKSTLMNILGLLDRPSSGDYFLENKKVSEMNDVDLARVRNAVIGFVFQGFNLLPRRTVLENISMPMFYAGLPRKERYERARMHLESVGLSKYADYYPTQMSGGQQQRVAIARALANHPDVILADEPTGNLDTKTSDEIMAIFKSLNKQSITVILVTHESDVARYANRLIQVKDGDIIYDGDMY
jgi:putative ABC transport system ATP-binding protein